MGGLTGAVHWWEEWQLRVLVLTSLLIQFFLLFFPFLRRMALPGWLRFMMWLAYQGGDAMAIYALATLFNRHKGEGGGGGGGGGGSSSNTLLEMVWAPVLLIHLGGTDAVTAYNIEDNEVWTRHLLTAASQVTVAVYVFCSSWPPGGDKRLLQVTILLFTVGVGKCFIKAWAFKRASIYSLVGSTAEAKQGNTYNILEEYVKHARDIVVQQQEEEDPGTITMKQAVALLCCPPGLRGERLEARGHQEKRRLLQERREAYKLFVDLSSPYIRRLNIFYEFWGLTKRRAYNSVAKGLAGAFFLLYTKFKNFDVEQSEYETGLEFTFSTFNTVFVLSRIVLLSASIALFHHSHREAYNSIDVKVTYALLCCTAVLEFYSASLLGFMMDFVGRHNISFELVWPSTVTQYSLAGYFVRNKKHNNMMRIVSFLGCKDFLDQLWCMEACFSSARITCLVLQYLKDGWKQKIRDAATYRTFNHHSNHWGLNMNRSFDECVLLWHLATDFCFFSSSFPDHRCAFAKPPQRLWPQLARAVMVQVKRTYFAKNPTSTTSRPQCSQESTECKAVQCRQMSNYMVYLLFVNPEMLLPGTRRNIFKTAYNELKGILKDWEWNPVHWSRCMPCGVKPIKEETTVFKKLIEIMKKNPEKRAETVITVTQEKSERSSQEGSSMKGSNKEEKFIDQAWDIAQKLLEMDEVKRWEEIQDVWVQMLCFSASRCRGYLHAKALGTGGEFLSYVWLLLFYMGMETFSERLQRELFPRSQADKGTSTDPPMTSEVCITGAGPPSASEICMAKDDIV